MKKIRTTPSGVKFLHNKEDCEISCVSVWSQAGARYDFSSKPGTAHVCEHLIGTPRKNNSALKGSEWLSQKGILSESWMDYSLVRQTHLQKSIHTEASIRFLCDQIFKFKFREDLFEQEKAAVKNESREYVGIYDRIWELAHEGLWPKSSFDRSLTDKESDIDNITKEDVEVFHKQHYFSTSSTLIIISPHDTGDIEGWIEKSVPEKINQQPQQIEQFTQPPKRLVVEDWNTEDTTIGISVKTVPVETYKETACIDIIIEILGGSDISRLLTKLRHDKGLTYSIYTKTDSYRDTGYFTIYFSVPNDEHQKALSIAFEELSKVIKGRIKKNELDMHRNNYITRYLADKESVKNRTTWYGKQTVSENNNILPIDEYIHMLEKITVSDVVETAQEYLKEDRISVGIVGPVNESNIDIPSLD